jgi:hypothetical protein
METPMQKHVIIAAASAEAAQRLAGRADVPRDDGPARNPARAAEGWRRWVFPAAPTAPRDHAAASAAVLAKVRKLLALAGDGAATEGEASNAAAAAQRLIEAHRLDEALLDAGEADAPPPEPEPVGANPDPLDVCKQVVKWRGILAQGIARANGCRMYWRGMRAICVVGEPSRVASVRQLYAWLSREVDRLGGEAARGRGRAYGHAWRVGCVERIAARLAEAARLGAAEAKATAIATLGGAALARIDRAAEAADASAAERRALAWMKSNLKLRSTGRTTISNASGYAAGREAGDRIRLAGHAALGRGAAGRIGGGR